MPDECHQIENELDLLLPLIIGYVSLYGSMFWQSVYLVVAGNGNYDIESFDLHNALFVFGTDAYSEPIVLDLTQTFSFLSELQNLLRIEEYIAPQLVIERPPDPRLTSASSTGLGSVMTMVHDCGHHGQPMATIV